MALTACEAWLAARLASPHRPGCDSDQAPLDAVETIQRHGLAVLACQFGSLPSAVQDRLTPLVDTSVKWSMLLQAEIQRLCELLDVNGIQALLLKGTALSHWLYNEPHLRASNDIDILVRDLAQARALAKDLAHVGYRWISSVDPAVGYLRRIMNRLTTEKRRTRQG